MDDGDTAFGDVDVIVMDIVQCRSKPTGRGAALLTWVRGDFLQKNRHTVNPTYVDVCISCFVGLQTLNIDTNV